MIAESTALFNLGVALISVWIAMLVNCRFLRPAVLNRKRFAIYELRDRLALLAMKGVVNESSEEYLTLLRLFNNCINSTKDFRITHFLRIQSAIIADQKLRRHLDSISQKIRNDQMPHEYRDIVAEFFICAREIYEHKVWTLRLMLVPLILLVSFIARGVRAARKFRNFLLFQKSRINDIEHELELNVTKFAA